MLEVKAKIVLKKLQFRTSILFLLANYTKLLFDKKAKCVFQVLY